MEACSQRSSLHFYAVDVAGNTYSNGSKKATAVGVCEHALVLPLQIFWFKLCLYALGVNGQLAIPLFGRFVAAHQRTPAYYLCPKLTWGVFPNCEILQPTIFDPDTFHVWKNEAFKVYTHTQ